MKKSEMSKSGFNYRFVHASQCAMCGAGIERCDVLGFRLNSPQGLAPWRKYGIAATVMKCGSCGLVFANPMPLPVDLNDHYDVEPEEYWTKDYLLPKSRPFERELLRLNQLSPIKVGQRALDIGSGVGMTMKSLSEAGFQSFGIEPSNKFRNRAISALGIPNDRIFHGSAESANFPPDYFDFITFGAVLEHLPNPGVALARAFQWLRPDGILHVEVPSANWLAGRLANLYYRLSGSSHVSNLSPMHPPFHLFEFRIESFVKHGLLIGYAVVEVEFFPCDTFLPAGLRALDPLFQFAMSATNTGMQMAVWLQRTSNNASPK